MLMRHKRTSLHLHPSLSPCTAPCRLLPQELIPRVSVAPLKQTCWPGEQCPLVGSVLPGLQPVSGSQSLPERGSTGNTGTAASPPETKSSRLVHFCPPSHSFYGLNSFTSLSPPCTHRRAGHPTDLRLTRSPTCSFPPDFLLLFRHTVQHLPVTHCVLWDKNCSKLNVFFSSGRTGSHKRPGKLTPGWCCASLATYHA